jgi:hypothetical protein
VLVSAVVVEDGVDRLAGRDLALDDLALLTGGMT